MSPIFVEVQL